MIEAGILVTSHIVMESLGDYLRREREYRHISLEEITQKTKIREEILTGLEEDRLDSNLSPVFIKGFLRAYAKYVGLNPDDVVLRYETSVREEKELRAKKSTGETPGGWIVRYLVLPISVLLLLGILLFFVLHRPEVIEKGSESQHHVESTTGSIPSSLSESLIPEEDLDSASPPSSDQQDTFVGPPPPLPSPPVDPPRPETPSGVQLQLIATEDTWLRIKIDEKPPKEILLRQGETISRRGDWNIEMTVGNAGGLEILHNGKNLGHLGESGKVLHLSISPEDVSNQGVSGSSSDQP